MDRALDKRLSEGCGQVAGPHQEVQIVSRRDKEIHIAQETEGDGLGPADAGSYVHAGVRGVGTPTLHPGLRVPAIPGQGRLGLPGSLFVVIGVDCNQSIHSQLGQGAENLTPYGAQPKNRYGTRLQVRQGETLQEGSG